MIGSIRKSRFSRFAITAIALPLAAVPVAAQSGVMTIELCSANGEVRRLSIPIDQEPGKDDCVNPCHACLSRKKSPKV